MICRAVDSLAEPSQVVPGGELSRPGARTAGSSRSRRVWRSSQTFEAGQVFVAVREQSVVLQQAAQVVDVAA